MPLGEELEDVDGALLLEGRLDVPALQRTLRRVQEQTGVDAGRATITVTAEVDVNGTMAGESITDRFAPGLAMQLNEHRLVPETDDAPTEASPTEGPDDTAPTGDIMRTQDGTVTVAGVEPSRLELAGRGLDVSVARPLAVVLFGLAMLALAAASLGAVRQGTLNEAARVRARYDSRMIEVESMQTRGDATIYRYRLEAPEPVDA